MTEAFNIHCPTRGFEPLPQATNGAKCRRGVTSKQKGCDMTETQKINLVLLPGLLNDARLYQFQVEDLSDMAQSTVGDLTGADTIAALATYVLAHAPQQFALAGLSMGGYVALEIMRQAPERVVALALLDTSARPDTPEATANRLKLMEQAETNFQVVLDTLMPTYNHQGELATLLDPGIRAALQAIR